MADTINIHCQKNKQEEVNFPTKSPPPQREQRIRERPSERNYIAENTGVVRYDALRSLGLGMGASETDVKNGDDESRRTSVGRQRNATEMIQ